MGNYTLADVQNWRQKKEEFKTDLEQYHIMKEILYSEEKVLRESLRDFITTEIQPVKARLERAKAHNLQTTLPHEIATIAKTITENSAHIAQQQQELEALKQELKPLKKQRRELQQYQTIKQEKERKQRDAEIQLSLLQQPYHTCYYSTPLPYYYYPDYSMDYLFGAAAYSTASGILNGISHYQATCNYQSIINKITTELQAECFQNLEYKLGRLDAEMSPKMEAQEKQQKRLAQLKQQNEEQSRRKNIMTQQLIQVERLLASSSETETMSIEEIQQQLTSIEKQEESQRKAIVDKALEITQLQTTIDRITLAQKQHLSHEFIGFYLDDPQTLLNSIQQNIQLIITNYENQYPYNQDIHIRHALHLLNTPLTSDNPQSNIQCLYGLIWMAYERLQSCNKISALIAPLKKRIQLGLNREESIQACCLHIDNPTLCLEDNEIKDLEKRKYQAALKSFKQQLYIPIQDNHNKAYFYAKGAALAHAIEEKEKETHATFDYKYYGNLLNRAQSYLENPAASHPLFADFIHADKEGSNHLDKKTRSLGLMFLGVGLILASLPMMLTGVLPTVFFTVAGAMLLWAGLKIYWDNRKTSILEHGIAFERAPNTWSLFTLWAKPPIEKESPPEEFICKATC